MRLEGLSAERFARLDGLLDQLIDIPEAQRHAQAEALCEGDTSLLEALLELLAAMHDDEPHPLDEALDPTVALTASEDPLEGQRAGPYELVEMLGAGGMGTVFRARRADGAYDRDVAVKVVRRGMDSLAILDRFHREREILARLEHPGIVRLVDAGLLDDGRPYLAMDLVDGEPLLDVTRERSVQQRVALIEQVCRAVSYAHERLIIHRDIKPSNVMVAAGDKALLLDFGVAKLVDDDEHTRVAERMLTPRWAAPEQFDGQVDVRTDVFAIGLLLHTVLTGRDHVTRAEDGSCPTPSPQAAPSDRSKIAGDLDAITATALRLDPADRYPSVRALADDLERHRRGLPVHARPDRWYRVRKTIARNLPAIGVAALFIVSLLAYSITITRQSRAIEAQRDRAAAQARRSRELSVFLTSLLTSENAQAVDGTELTVTELLNRAQRRLEDEHFDADIHAELSLITAQAFHSVGQWDEGLAMARQVASDEALSAERRAEGATTMANIQVAAYAPRLVRRYGLIGIALACDDGHLLSPATASAIDALASGMQLENPVAGRALFALSILIHAVTDGPFSPQLASPLISLATTSEGGSEFLLDWAIVTLHGTPSRDGVVADAMHKYGRAIDDPALAIELLDQALSIERRIYGDHHPYTLNTLNDLGLAIEPFDPDRAVTLLTEATDTIATRLPQDHPRRLLAELNLGAVLRDADRFAEANRYLARALDVCESAQVGMTVIAARHLGELRLRQNDPEGARQAFARALPLCGRAEQNYRDRLARSWLQLDEDDSTLQQLRDCIGRDRLEALLQEKKRPNSKEM